MCAGETTTDVREVFVGKRIKSAEITRTGRSLMLMLDDGTGVIVSANAYQAIAIEADSG